MALPKPWSPSARTSRSGAPSRTCRKESNISATDSRSKSGPPRRLAAMHEPDRKAVLNPAFAVSLAVKPSHTAGITTKPGSASRARRRSGGVMAESCTWKEDDGERTLARARAAIAGLREDMRASATPRAGGRCRVARCRRGGAEGIAADAHADPVRGRYFDAKRSNIFAATNPHRSCLRAGSGASVLGSKGVRGKPCRPTNSMNSASSMM